MKENDVKHLKEQIEILLKRLRELEQNTEVLLENRKFQNEERQRLLTKLQEKENYLKFVEECRQKAALNFIEALMENYPTSFPN